MKRPAKAGPIRCPLCQRPLATEGGIVKAECPDCDHLVIFVPRGHRPPMMNLADWLERFLKD